MRGGTLQHEAESSFAQLDGADDALLLQLAGFFEGDVSGYVHGCQFFADQEHSRFGGSGEFGDVFSVA